MKAFISYTRSKDAFHAIAHFRDRLENEMRLRVPGATVFQDTSHIQEGEHFPSKIAEELAQTDVLIVLMSPAWLLSQWCRKEFDLFTSNGSDSKRTRQVLPVLWIETPGMHQGSTDPIAALLSGINYSDWQDLRHLNWSQPTLKRQMDQLAERVLALAAPVSG